MSRFMVMLSGILILGVLLGASVGCSGEKTSEQAAEEWLLAVGNMEALEADDLTCSSERENLRGQMTMGSALRFLGQAFLASPIDIEIDTSDVSFSTVTQDDYEAIVLVRGVMRGSVGGSVSSEAMDEQWRMVKENGEWLWCGDTMTLFASPVEGNYASADSPALSEQPDPEVSTDSNPPDIQESSEQTVSEPVLPWELIPLGYAKSQEGADPGWENLTVFFALKNNTDKFQTFEGKPKGSEIITEEGYVYPLEDRAFLNTPVTIPPGFVVWATTGGIGVNRDVESIFFEFKVAENTGGYTVRIPGYGDISLKDTPIVSLSERDIKWDHETGRLDQAIASATDRSNISFFDEIEDQQTLGVGSTVEIGSDAEIELTSVARDNYLDEDFGVDKLEVGLVYRNKHGGYGKQFHMDYYLFDDHGRILYIDESNNLNTEVGPGQENLVDLEFVINQDVERAWLVILGEAYGIFDLGSQESFSEEFWEANDLEAFTDMINRAQPLLLEAFETNNPDLLQGVFVDSPRVGFYLGSIEDITTLFDCSSLSDWGNNYVYHVTSTILDEAGRGPATNVMDDNHVAIRVNQGYRDEVTIHCWDDPLRLELESKGWNGHENFIYVLCNSEKGWRISHIYRHGGSSSGLMYAESTPQEILSLGCEASGDSTSVNASGTDQPLAGEETSDAPGTDVNILPGAETVPLENMAFAIPWLPMDPNKVPAVSYYAFNTSLYPFDNPKVRQAFSLSIDNSEFASFAENGGRPATTFTHPDVLGRDLYDQTGLGYDPQRARELLEEAGFPNGDGFPLVWLAFADYGSNYEMAEKARDMWRDALGVEVELESTSDFSDYIRMLDAEPPQIFGLGWRADINDPDNFFRPLFHSIGESNRSHYSSEKLDSLVESASTVGDPAARQQLYIEAEKILIEEDAVVIPLYHYFAVNGSTDSGNQAVNNVQSDQELKISETNASNLTSSSAIVSSSDHTVAGTKQILIEEGFFLLGASQDDSNANSNEKPQRSVYLEDFWIDETEVTNSQFAQFLSDIGNHWDACFDQRCMKTKEDHELSRISRADGIYRAEPGFENHPVTMVTWYGAAAYCQWANRRLPTEAEWEKSARGENGQIFPWGNAFEEGVANFCDRTCEIGHRNTTYNDGFAQIGPVGSHPLGASPYGILDMAGNVTEYVADWYDETAYKTISENYISGPETGSEKVLRGGSWISYSVDLRSSYRGKSTPESLNNHVGFRCARSD